MECRLIGANLGTFTSVAPQSMWSEYVNRVASVMNQNEIATISRVDSDGGLPVAQRPAAGYVTSEEA